MMDLLKAAGIFDSVSLAIGFKTTTLFVFANDPDACQKLSKAVEQGGDPVGMIAQKIDHVHGKVRVFFQPIAKYRNNAAAMRYLSPSDVYPPFIWYSPSIC
jgi:hypothetical protein